MLNLIIDRFNRNADKYYICLSIDEDIVIFEQSWYFSNPKPDTQIFEWFNNFSMPNVKKQFPPLFANKITSVQPMKSPVGLAYAMKTLYSSACNTIASITSKPKPKPAGVVYAPYIPRMKTNTVSLSAVAISGTYTVTKPDPMLTLEQFDKLVTSSIDKKYVILNYHHPILERINENGLNLRDYWKARMKFGKKEIALIEYGKRFFKEQK